MGGLAQKFNPIQMILHAKMLMMKSVKFYKTRSIAAKESDKILIFST
jgi:hypothetical protein